MLKTLLAELDGRLVCGVVPVSGSLDLKALAAALGGKRAVMAQPAAAERSSGYVVGGISPLGQRTALPTAVDEPPSCSTRSTSAPGAAGSRSSWRPATLLRLTGAVVRGPGPLEPDPPARARRGLSRVPGKATVAGRTPASRRQRAARSADSCRPDDAEPAQGRVVAAAHEVAPPDGHALLERDREPQGAGLVGDGHVVRRLGGGGLGAAGAQQRGAAGRGGRGGRPARQRGLPGASRRRGARPARRSRRPRRARPRAARRAASTLGRVTVASRSRQHHRVAALAGGDSEREQRRERAGRVDAVGGVGAGGGPLGGRQRGQGQRRGGRRGDSGCARRRTPTADGAGDADGDGGGPVSATRCSACSARTGAAARPAPGGPPARRRTPRAAPARRAAARVAQGVVGVDRGGRCPGSSRCTPASSSSAPAREHRAGVGPAGQPTTAGDGGGPAPAARLAAAGYRVDGRCRPPTTAEQAGPPVTASAARLAQLVTPVVAGAGYDLEDLTVTAAGKRSVVRVLVDKDGGVDPRRRRRRQPRASARRSTRPTRRSPTCSATSYVLEVSSPGVDRPLTEPRHWRRNIGRLVVGHAAPTAARSTGRVAVGRRRPRVMLDVDGSEAVLPYAELARGAVQVEFSRKGSDRADDADDDEDEEDDA